MIAAWHHSVVAMPYGRRAPGAWSLGRLVNFAGDPLDVTDVSGTFLGFFGPGSQLQYARVVSPHGAEACARPRGPPFRKCLDHWGISVALSHVRRSVEVGSIDEHLSELSMNRRADARSWPCPPTAAS